jgi:hypothetical protein
MQRWINANVVTHRVSIFTLDWCVVMKHAKITSDPMAKNLALISIFDKLICWWTYGRYVKCESQG